MVGVFFPSFKLIFFKSWRNSTSLDTINTTVYGEKLYLSIYSSLPKSSGPPHIEDGRQKILIFFFRFSVTVLHLLFVSYEKKVLNRITLLAGQDNRFLI
jgi:hypothetical protein